MEHQYLTDADREQVMLYALGSLSPDETDAFASHLETGCDLCTDELQAIKPTIAWLGYQAPPVQPPSTMRQRLVDRLPATERSSDSAPPTDATSNPGLNPAFTFVRADEGEWQPLGPGMEMKHLFHDPITNRDTALMRMAPGTRLPPHRHHAVEELFVVEGDCHLAPGLVLGPGDYFRAEAGSEHDITYTEEGTTFLTLYAVEFLT